MTQNEIEIAIFALQELLEGDDRRESEFQQYFQDHPSVLQLFGYVEARPRVRLPLSDEMQASTGLAYLEPDFICKKANGTYEIVDLKTPKEKLVRDIPGREIFHAKTSEYISQVTNYAQYFDDRENRRWAQDNLGAHIHKDPDCVIIVGRDIWADKPLIHKELRERTNRLTIYTFDDVLTALLNHYNNVYGSADSLSGLSIHAIIATKTVPIPMFRCIFGASQTTSKNRVALFSDGRNLEFQVVDGYSAKYQLRTPIPDSYINSKKPLYIAASFGGGPAIGVVQIRINNSIVAETKLTSSLKFTCEKDELHTHVGRDIDGAHSNGMAFVLVKLLLIGQIPAIRDLREINNYYYDDLQRGVVDQGVYFQEGTGMSTVGSDPDR